MVSDRFPTEGCVNASHNYYRSEESERSHTPLILRACMQGAGG